MRKKNSNNYGINHPSSQLLVIFFLFCIKLVTARTKKFGSVTIVSINGQYTPLKYASTCVLVVVARSNAFVTSNVNFSSSYIQCQLASQLEALDNRFPQESKQICVVRNTLTHETHTGTKKKREQKSWCHATHSKKEGTTKKSLGCFFLFFAECQCVYSTFLPFYYL